MKLYRCYNGKCVDNGVPGFDFEAADGQPAKCPKCGVDKTDPRFGRIIVDRVQMHFDAPSGIVDGRGVGYIACDPSKRVGKYRATGSPGAVTCVACKATESFRAAALANSEEVHPDYQVTATVDQEKGTIVLATKYTPAPCGGC